MKNRLYRTFQNKKFSGEWILDDDNQYDYNYSYYHTDFPGKIKSAQLLTYECLGSESLTSIV